MKKIRNNKTQTDTEMREEYLLDYNKARPNRFAKRLSKMTRVIVLEQDVAEAFQSPLEINQILRAAAQSKRKAVAKPKRAPQRGASAR